MEKYKPEIKEKNEGEIDYGTSEQFELEMIKVSLLLNPENINLSPEDFEKLAIQEFKDSRD
jgi:hypothetical protein